MSDFQKHTPLFPHVDPYGSKGLVHDPISAAISSAVASISTAVTAITSTVVGKILFGVAISLALSAVSSAFTPSPESIGTSPEERGYLVTAKGSAREHQIIYGETKVGGIVVFQQVTGKTNKQLHQVIAFAGHEIESFESVYVDDWELTYNNDGQVTSAQNVYQRNRQTNKFNGLVDVYEHLGSDNQAVDRRLYNRVNKWRSSSRLRGIAYLYVRLTADADVWVNGVPNITAKIKGKKVYDPRSGSTAYSNNAALCIRDYITADYGLGESNSNVDDTVFSVAANECEKKLNNNQNKFEINGAFTTNLAPGQVLEDMSSAMAGTVWYSQGKWRCKPGYWTTPVASFDENDLRSPLSIQTRFSRRESFNAVKGKARGNFSDWQVADYTPVKNDRARLDDNDDEFSYLNLDLPFTSSNPQCQYIALIALEKQRQQIVVEARFNMKGFAVQIGDNVTLTNERAGWTNKEFEVIGWNFGVEDNGALYTSMTLKETSEEIFDTDFDVAVYEKDNTDLPSPFDGPEVGINLETRFSIINQEVNNVLVVNIGSSDSSVYAFETQFKKSSNNRWKTASYGSSDSVEIYGLEETDYDVRVRAISTLGVRGDWTTITNFRLDPVPQIPATVTGFSGNIQGENILLSWDPVDTVTLSHYEIRYSPATSGVTYSNAAVIVDKVPRPATSVYVPTRSGTYLIKAADKKGTRSAAADSFVVFTNLSDIINLNVVESLEESPEFSGTFDQTVAVTDENNDAYLTLDSQGLFDDVTGLFDDAPGLFDSGLSDGIYLSGTYQFSDVIDLGAKFNSLITTEITYISEDNGIDFDSAGGLFDVRPGDFDGDPDQLDNATAYVEISTTDDDPNGSPTWSDWSRFISGNIAARAYRFRAVLTSEDGSTVPQVTGLSASVDMPDRVVSGNDIDVTGTANISFTPKFYTDSNPAVGVGLTGLATGDYYEITNKDNEGFTITLYDSTDAQLTNTVQLDYVAKGYGKEIA